MTQKEPLVDASALLALTGELREVQQRVERAKVSDEQRSRWQRRLLGIATAAQEDLTRASQALHRFEHELDRQLP